MAAAAKVKAEEKELTWVQRVEMALRKVGGKGRLTEIAAAVPLPKDWNPAKHLGSDKEGQGESINSRVWSTLQKGERFKKVQPGVYALVVTVKKRQVFKVGEKK